MKKLLLAATLLAGAANAELVTKPTNAADLFDFADASRYIVRMRALMVNPDEDSNTSIGGKIQADASITPEVDVTYFFTKNIAAELIAATTKHDMSAVNTTSGNLDLGDVWLLPPTLTMQYHFCPDSRVRPYAGAGVNYTVFYNENDGGVSSVEYENGFGTALQAGVDIGIDEHLAVNFDVKKLYLSTDAKVNGTVTANVDLDPWIVGAGMAYRF
ncbi:MAG: OmpW family outer membrane protein [Alphaproteobacteria bacterium]